MHRPAFTAAVYQHAWQEGPYEAAAALETALAPPSDVGNPLAHTDFARKEDEVLARLSRSQVVVPAGLKPATNGL